MSQERAKNACNPCRERKRKCDGQTPCQTCIKANCNCIYEKRSRKRRRLPATPDEPTDGPRAKSMLLGSSGTPPRLSVEVNSGAVLARRLGLSTNLPSSGGLHLISWNLGLRGSCTDYHAPLPLAEILTVSHMQELASIYFSEIHTVYNFMDRDVVQHAILAMTDEKRQLFDPRHCILLGIAALACLFSDQPSGTEAQIINSARVALEHSNTLESPSPDHVIGWLLRVIYLRLTSSPHATWMASCTMMHMVETTNLHLEPSENASNSYHPELRRRIYSVAQLFHMWISYDYGRSRVELRGASCSLPAEGWTADQITVWQSSDSLDPDRYLDSTELEGLLSQTVDLQLKHPLLQLKRTNVGLCIYRRLRVSGRSVSHEAINQVLCLADEGIETAVTLAHKRSPWWHIANVPFQVICVLLAINTKSSLERVQKSLDALRLIADCYKTNAIKEAYTSACSIINIQLQRKKEEYDLLNNMEGHIAPLASETRALSQPGVSIDSTSPMPQTTDFGGFGAEDFLNLDQMFSANLFAPYG